MIERSLVPHQGFQWILLMPGDIVCGNAMFEVVRGLLPCFHEQLRGGVKVTSAFTFHALRAQLHDRIVRVHDSHHIRSKGHAVSEDSLTLVRQVKVSARRIDYRSFASESSHRAISVLTSRSAWRRVVGSLPSLPSATHRSWLRA